MTKYIISSGTSVVCELLEIRDLIEVKVTNKASKAITYDTIGEAMVKTSKVNDILGSYKFQVMSIEHE